MLKIHLGDLKKAIYNTEVFFKNTYMDKWFSDPLTREMIKDVDKSEVISNNLIKSPILGDISPRDLSGGVKTLILMRHAPKNIYNISTCGDNCAKWILELAKDEDIIVNLNHIMNFGKKFKVYIMNENREIDNMKDFIITASKYI